MQFYTIGVYHSSELDFFESLKKNEIDTFCDIRQRRGVRGAKYSFVNSKRLQIKLAEIGIKYQHILNLAPTTEIRQLQYEADIKEGVNKRDRDELGQIFKITYKNKILDNFDLKEFIKSLEYDGAKKIVLFCVEQSPKACHRSIIADKLSRDYNYEIIHL
ncbi:MAG: DUF488 domain-containing protein [Flavobacteriales bacterium]|nr:DUF488 domain-containing protein [Flavobacteriales bacterium]MCW8937658.1 DUF488 domain-containing protein [Flavobacteriales bacterium]MCW8967580.1 DUF488 domain-containing protein [Flavobacteriales bacterium]MCW8990146.1 DUF488 domain-containing protein [Flavobacteriales bacterium]MCW9019864.1 DUF488 domain-containing protein [Flavobacteriales bacterium]